MTRHGVLAESSSVIYKKRPGVLRLSNDSLSFVDRSSTNSLLDVSITRISALFTSKADSPKAMLRIRLNAPKEDVANTEYNFTFVGSAALNDREVFKTHLAALTSRNQAPPQRNGSDQSSLANGSRSASPGLPTASGSRPRSTPPQDHEGENDDRVSIRLQLLRSNASLAALHRDLVLSGQLTEEEFWDDPRRQSMLDATSASVEQKRGKSSRPVDPRPRTTETGDVKISINAQMIHDIFEQYPIVAQAYQDNVPNRLDERQFWQRYFQSRLFNQTRPGITVSDQKDDDIFDQYLLEIYRDDEIEPKHMKQTHVHRMLDLAAQSVDHEETGNAPDITMRAGRNKAALPLMRHFNAHSQRLLDTTMGEADTSGTQEGAHDINEYYYGEIALEDLESDHEDPHVLLEIQDQQRYFETQNSQLSAVEDERTRQYRLKQISLIIGRSKKRVAAYDARLVDFEFDAKKSNIGIQSILTSTGQKARAKANKGKVGTNYKVPEEILSAMVSCQAATNEFLRHFWMSSVPQKNSSINAGKSQSQRYARASRMISYLEKTEARVEATLAPARSRGDVDYNLCRKAFGPMLEAVGRALEYHSAGK